MTQRCLSPMVVNGRTEKIAPVFYLKVDLFVLYDQISGRRVVLTSLPIQNLNIKMKFYLNTELVLKL